VPKKYVPDEMERRVLAQWGARRDVPQQAEQGRAAYEASKRDPARRFVFLEGPPPPTACAPGPRPDADAEGLRQPLPRDAGKWVPRKAGWDCHGLPVEIEVQKELGIEHVDEVLAYGLAKFNAKCRDSVFRYKKNWEEMSERVGFWLDYEHPYVTMEDGYIESVWWGVSSAFSTPGLLFKSYKVVPYCPQTGTSYSSTRSRRANKDVVDTSIYAKFHLVGDPENARILSLDDDAVDAPRQRRAGRRPRQVRLREGPRREGQRQGGREGGRVLILARRSSQKALRNESTILAEFKGRDLVGRSYAPLFPGAVDAGSSKTAWTVVPAAFVTSEDGTGVVHTGRHVRRGRLPARHEGGAPGESTRLASMATSCRTSPAASRAST